MRPLLACLLALAWLNHSLAQAPLPAPAPRPEGWSCGAYPCADDLEGWQRRVRLSPGYALDYVGRFPGQVQQLTLGPQGALYATVWERGTAQGAVYSLGEDGKARSLTPALQAPYGLTYDSASQALYISARRTPEGGGSLLRLWPDGRLEALREDLPCCQWPILGNQPNGLALGADGGLYVGVGALTDRAESPNPRVQSYAAIGELEAAILRYDLETGELRVVASGIRNPTDIAFGPAGQAYALDSGLLSGPGDRLLAWTEGGFYGWPYWGGRGCDDCPPNLSRQNPLPDLVTFPPYSLPRGLVVYQGDSFPPMLRGTLFVALWNGTDQPSRLVWIDPQDPRLLNPTPEQPYEPVDFVVGLGRISDVIEDVQGGLLLADSVYGHIWRVRYDEDAGGFSQPSPTSSPTGDESATPFNPLAPLSSAHDRRAGALPGRATPFNPLAPLSSPTPGAQASPTQAALPTFAPFVTNTPTSP